MFIQDYFLQNEISEWKMRDLLDSYLKYKLFPRLDTPHNFLCHYYPSHGDFVRIWRKTYINASFHRRHLKKLFHLCAQLKQQSDVNVYWKADSPDSDLELMVKESLCMSVTNGRKVNSDFLSVFNEFKSTDNNNYGKREYSLPSSNTHTKTTESHKMSASLFSAQLQEVEDDIEILHVLPHPKVEQILTPVEYYKDENRKMIAKKSVQKFEFFHQTLFQQVVLLKYGQVLFISEIVPNNCTGRALSVSMYLLLVRTNVDYQVVGTVLMNKYNNHCEVLRCILLRFKEINKLWNPRLLMIDPKDDLISIATELFPGLIFSLFENFKK